LRFQKSFYYLKSGVGSGTKQKFVFPFRVEQLRLESFRKHLIVPMKLIFLELILSQTIKGKIEECCYLRSNESATCRRPILPPQKNNPQGHSSRCYVLCLFDHLALESLRL
jgi:hypothetical protein